MRRWWWMAVVCLAVLAAIGPQPARAIPAFARREGLSCQVCHFRMPELNETGREYLRRGLRMPGVEEPAPRALGEPLGLKLGDYVSVMGEPNVVLGEGEETQFNAGTIDLWLGGPLSTRWSALANIGFDIDEGGSDVEVAYAHGTTNNQDHFYSGRLGQVMPFAIQFNQGGPSLPLSTPVVLETPADTGTTWTPTTLVRGGEVGLVHFEDWIGYVGAGQPNPEDFTGERHTDFYLSVERRITPHPVTFYGYGYWGQSDLFPEGDMSFHRLGIFADYLTGRAQGVFGYLGGSDDVPGEDDLDSGGWFLLAEWLPSDRLGVYARWDQFQQDLIAGGGQITHGPTLGMAWWLQTELKVGVETQFLRTSGEDSEGTLTVDLLWIF